VTEVAERYADRDWVAVRVATLLPTLGSFTRAYDDVRRGDIPWALNAESGRSAVRNLVVTARMWLPLVVRDLQWIDRANYLDSTISDDLNDDIDALLALLRDARDSEGAYLAYRAQAITALDDALRAAQAKWFEAEAHHLDYTARIHDLRWKSVNFDAELNWFRQSLACVVGHTHSDYVRLLPSHAWHHDDAEDPGSPQPEIVEPATLVTGIPKILEA
jgi:hypothetical protein